ncbi:16S rRNA (cytosine(1402)-N(4))-methyltransferase RsmH [Phycisphaera mikurensis]|uniref:Ribosomal RNA small subunit methyltransferase H n=1 Tax=Phycisphaera mikurensis (strain NBRC 102666 / KCTC 22515 / FYK2301M01) TaxID=1142394 RepID=I0IDR0_PHYMF|nr:16S rRNA (cytosine(1402)-N(4))-methyltransferase RsmH [Phycisphaera mikurensis]MBB6441213.1 16S rRNA (cytosine1402-N4)-methyltransferase [Phycisphaera mikurensis]BAM03398.1 ribosomal RNA small subunit methyltransferase H [Phycisphaera mikurensis NBRC 102666]
MSDALPPTPDGHVPVLPAEVENLLAPALGPGAVLLDATLGRGGHARRLLPLLPGGTVIGFDLDAGNLAHAGDRLRPIAEAHGVRLILHHGSFAGAEAVVANEAPGGVDALLADLGFASNQVDDPARGFSFRHDGPLDMRLDAGDAGRPTAADLVNTLGQDELADLIYLHGEERLSRRIARRIVEARQQAPIETTLRLAELVFRCYPPPKRRGGGPPRHPVHPATRTFQALRIAVNGELDALASLLDAIPRLLRPGGHAAVISFHSLEDRPVKRAFLRFQQQDLGRRLTRKPLTAADDEAAANPRSRSAKLRGFAAASAPNAPR